MDLGLSTFSNLIDMLSSYDLTWDLWFWDDNEVYNKWYQSHTCWIIKKCMLIQSYMIFLPYGILEQEISWQNLRIFSRLGSFFESNKKKYQL